MNFGFCSHVGKVREQNEDSFCIGDNFVIVADGMGGHNKGEVASNMAVEIIKNNILADSQILTSETNIKNVLNKSLSNANQEIYNSSLKDPALLGMGTTVVSGIWLNNTAVVANVGDSRCYIISNGNIEQITTDHTLVQQLVNEGKITPKEALEHKDRNIITRAVGSDPDVEIDIIKVSINTGDILVFCSDGLTNFVTVEDIKNELSVSKNIQSSVEHLVDLANENGGFDNITLVAVKF